MVDIVCTVTTLTVSIRGFIRFLAWKSHLDLPLDRIERVEHDPSVGFPGLIHIRMPGTYFPGLFAFGTIISDGHRRFWALRKPEQAIVITLRNHEYSSIIVQVDNPRETVQYISSAVASRRVPT